MSLSKQLYLIITFTFLLIFTGNTIISIQNTKLYLEQESTSKAQDTATSLGMMLKSLISNKKDPEIASTINAISDSGFYSSIRLEDHLYTFTDKELLEQIDNLKDFNWKIDKVIIDKEYGEIILNEDDNLLDELLDESNEELKSNNLKDNSYTFVPTNKFKNNSYLKIDFKATNNYESLDMSVKLKLSNVLVNSTRAIKFDDVPQWFIDFIPISLEEQKSTINDGWKTAAVIYVKANPGVAYLKLYTQVKDELLYAIIAFLISIILLSITLKLVLKPLKEIELLANKISQGSYDTVIELPWTKELKSVSIAMNIMSSKIKNIISKLNNNIKEISTEITKDPLTKLHNKQSFEDDLKNCFMNKKDGYMFLIQISKLGDFAQVNGRNSVNDFLIEFSNILKNTNNATAYRFYGSEFAMIVHESELSKIKDITKNLKEKFELLSIKVKKDDVANIGVVLFSKLDTLGAVLSGVSEAYEMAKQIGPNESYIKEVNNDGRGMLEWKNLVFDIIARENINIDYIGDIICNTTNKLLMQEAFSSMKDKKNENIPIGIFLSVAQANNKVIEFDMIIVKKVIEYIKDKNIKTQILINLSMDSIQDVIFLSWLKNIIKENHQIANQLVFALTAHSISHFINEFESFVRFAKEQNSQTMIKRFDVKFIEIDNLKKLKPNSIRLSRDYTSCICDDVNKKSLVDSICQISELVNIDVYAENVQDDRDFNVMRTLDINGASRC
ncbi:MAG TPA: EAL domain-containing protein [Arcobacter sp.]|nr:EAL domain-containing protein [Arcobacter sp.]